MAKTTSFKCRRCGECCKHRGDVNILPMDILKISQFLEISPQQFLDEYTKKEYIKQWDCILKSKGDAENTCIFYENAKCKINSVKPAACFYFPFLPNGSEFEINSFGCWQKNKEDSKNQCSIEKVLFDSCSRYKEEKQIRNETIRIINLIDRKKINKDSPHGHKLYELLYEGYSLEVDFEQQVRERFDKIEEILIFI